MLDCHAVQQMQQRAHVSLHFLHVLLVLCERLSVPRHVGQLRAIGVLALSHTFTKILQTFPFEFARGYRFSAFSNASALRASFAAKTFKILSRKNSDCLKIKSKCSGFWSREGEGTGNLDVVGGVASLSTNDAIDCILVVMKLFIIFMYSSFVPNSTYCYWLLKVSLKGRKYLISKILQNL